MSKRVLFIWSRLPGYAVSSLKELKNTLSGDVMVCSYGQVPPYIKKSDLEYLKVNESLTFSIPWYKRLKILYQIISDFQPDYFIVSGWQYPLLLLFSVVLRLAGKKTVSMIDTPYKSNDRAQKFKIKFGSIVLRSCFSSVWVAGKLSRKLMEMSGFQSARIVDNLYCADSKTYRWNENKEIGDYFLYVGRLATEKNIDKMLDSFLEYRKVHSGCMKMIVVGAGNQELERYQNNAAIEFLGALGSDKISTLMQNARAFVLLSKYEPWGVVVHEAVLCGLPLILSSEVGAHHDFLDDKKNGFLLRSASISQVAKCFSKLEDDNLVRQFSSHSLYKSRNRTVELWCRNVYSKILS